jgi:hypothetical protein
MFDDLVLFDLVAKDVHVQFVDVVIKSLIKAIE